MNGIGLNLWRERRRSRPVGGPTIIYSSPFDDTNDTSLAVHLPAIGVPLTLGVGADGRIQSGKAVFSDVGDFRHNDAWADVGGAAQEAQVKIDAPSASVAAWASVRLADRDNKLLASLESDDGGVSYYTQLHKRVAGTNTDIGGGPVALTGIAGTQVTLRITVNAANAVSVYVNGVLTIGPVTDATGASNTKAGFGGISHSGGGYAGTTFDDPLIQVLL